MPDFILKLFDVLKLSLKVVVAIFLTSAILLIIPSSVVEFLGLTQFNILYRSWISILFILTGFLIIANVCVSIYKYGSQQINGGKQQNICPCEEL
jgi:hypothetical protein